MMIQAILYVKYFVTGKNVPKWLVINVFFVYLCIFVLNDTYHMAPQESYICRAVI